MVIGVNLVKQTWFFAWCCHVGVVVRMPSQCWVSPPLAAIIAARRRVMLASRHCRRATGISAHPSSRAWRSSPRFWGGFSILVIARPNSSQICSVELQFGDLASCSILVMLPCWRKSRTMQAWRCRLGSSSYPRNAAWKMAQRYFAPCPCRAHWWRICRGAQEAIWCQCEKFPRCYTEPPSTWAL